MEFAHTRSDLDATLTRDLIEVTCLVAVEDTEVDGVFGRDRKRLEMRPGDARHERFMLAPEAEFEQPRTQPVPLTRSETKILARNECGRQTMRGAAGYSQMLRQPRQVGYAVRDCVDDVERACERLRAGRYASRAGCDGLHAQTRLATCG